MKKPIIIVGVIVILVVLWYFFAPIKWTFGFRSPKNFAECIKAGGNVTNDGQQKSAVCYYKNLIFDPYLIKVTN